MQNENKALTAEETLNRFIPNFSTVEKWKVILMKDFKDNFIF